MKWFLIISVLVILAVIFIVIKNNRDKKAFDDNCRRSNGIVEISGERCNYLKTM